MPRFINSAVLNNLIGSTAYGYDNGGRETSITHKDSSGATIDAFNDTYDAASRVTQETSTLGGTRNYCYDATNQLTSDETNTNTFDANGNRTNSGYSTGTGNRLRWDGTCNYIYDDEGNRTEKDDISGAGSVGNAHWNAWADLDSSGSWQRGGFIRMPSMRCSRGGIRPALSPGI